MSDTETEKLAVAAEQAKLAHEFCPGSYTMSALQACLAAQAALNDVVVMPREVFAAVEVLIDAEFYCLINEHNSKYEERINFLRREGNIESQHTTLRVDDRQARYGETCRRAADELEAAALLCKRWWSAQTKTAHEDGPDLFGETGGEETNTDQHGRAPR